MHFPLAQLQGQESSIKPLVSILHRLGMRIVVYLDDFLILNQNQNGIYQDRDSPSRSYTRKCAILGKVTCNINNIRTFYLIVKYHILHLSIYTKTTFNIYTKQLNPRNIIKCLLEVEPSSSSGNRDHSRPSAHLYTSMYQQRHQAEKHDE